MLPKIVDYLLSSSLVLVGVFLVEVLAILVDDGLLEVLSLFVSNALNHFHCSLVRVLTALTLVYLLLESYTSLFRFLRLLLNCCVSTI